MRKKKDQKEEVYTRTQKQQCLKQWPGFPRKYQIIFNIRDTYFPKLCILRKWIPKYVFTKQAIFHNIFIAIVFGDSSQGNIFVLQNSAEQIINMTIFR